MSNLYENPILTFTSVLSFGDKLLDSKNHCLFHNRVKLKTDYKTQRKGVAEEKKRMREEKVGKEIGRKRMREREIEVVGCTR